MVSSLILKLKRDASTYMVFIDHYVPGKLNVNTIRNSVVKAINGSGGLQPSVVEGKEQASEDGEVKLEDTEVKAEEPDTKGQILSLDQLRIAVPQDKTNPYANKWTELDDETAAEILFQDYDVLAFATSSDSRFYIQEPVYD